MNISWYQDTTLIGTENNINNGTYNKLFLNATTRAGNYILNITVNDGLGNWANETINFKTEGYPGVIGQVPSNYAIGVIGILGLVGIALFFIKRRRDKRVY
jgi:LPXTG-motif cell wall-anchored protein